MSLNVEIRKKYGDFVLESAFSAGEGITCLLGPSGCGKSVTLKCIAGLERPDEGYIELNGRVLFDSASRICLPPQERRVGYLFQNYALFPNMTVRQNILCGMHAERNRETKERKLEEMLTLFQLHGLENHRTWQLSGGQAQRTALARILVNQPQMLMLDEPFSALDTHLREKLAVELKALLQQFGHEVLMVTHSREEAYKMAGQIAVMDQGKLLSMKPTKELFADPGSREAALLTGCKNIFGAEKTGEREVFVPEWQVRLRTAKPVKDGLKAIGIRAHYFDPTCRENTFPVVYCGEMEEPFEWILEFRAEGQKEDSPRIWWRLPKEKRPEKFPEKLGITPDNIMLLY